MFKRALPCHTKAENNAQDMFLWPGIRLIGCGGTVARGIFVHVESLGDTDLQLDNGTRLAYEDLHKCLRLAHCLTYASAQGLTLRGRVRLETLGVHFTIKHLYVGASRVTSSDLLEVS